MLHHQSIPGRAAPVLWAAGLVAIMAFAPAKGPKTAKAAKPAIVSSHYYRNSVDTLTAPPRTYLNEVPASVASHGVYIKVDRDGQGRVVRTSRVEEGVVQGYTDYDYAPGAKLPNREITFNGGVETGYSKIARDPKGRIDRFDDYTAQNVRTGYTVLSHAPDHDSYIEYSADGAELSRSEEYFNADGVETKYVSHGRDGVRTTERTYDPVIGLVTGLRAEDNGKLSYTVRYSYDSDDVISRTDTYDPDGKPYVYSLFDHGREVKKVYNFSDGTKEEVDYAYDRRHWMVSSKMTVNGSLICTFTFDREPDGTVKRTLATGADGTLWAEYPNLFVTEVRKDGHANQAPTVGIFHKSGDWY